jgi:hypothetical protein
VLLLHVVVGSPHVLLPQHGWPAPPHATQLPLVHAADGAVHVWLVQQA